MTDGIGVWAGRRRRARLGLAAAGFALLGSAAPALAQASDCPPPRKLAAGACVAACPAGYEDQGRACVYRNMSR